eukprot:5084054-Prymnesium_polylepis.1
MRQQRSSVAHHQRSTGGTLVHLADARACARPSVGCSAEPAPCAQSLQPHCRRCPTYHECPTWPMADVVAKGGIGRLR